MTTQWKDLRLTRKATVLVTLCGKSLDMIWLQEQEHRVIGVEMNALAASDLFTESGLHHKQSKASLK